MSESKQLTSSGKNVYIYAMKRRKSLLFISAAIVCSLPLWSKADFSGFVEQLNQSNFPVNKILASTGVTRYELSRLLNATECKDCINPDKSYLNTYTGGFWTNFVNIPGKDFNDILYANAAFANKNYFYCVAYVGDNWYMRWYPLKTSPICPGQFCGTRYTTKAEFLQVVMNMISKYIYAINTINWQSAKDWIYKLSPTDYQYKIFSASDIATIESKAKTCVNQSCVLESTNELNVYLKYCMFNLNACGMMPIGNIKEWFWPVAELNLLAKQNILTIDEAAKYNVNEIIDGALLLKILSNMNSIIGCSFNNDYDCDWISNSQDSCPNSYNPHQTDTDRDWIWDVCDDDIDGDGSKNPIWIVDDNWKIIVKLRTPTMDNCLFTINPDQKDNNNNHIWDVCDIGWIENLSLAITSSSPKGSVPETISFKANHVSSFSSYSWDFGDGSYKAGESVNHSYTTPWLYSVRLIATMADKKQSVATTTVVIGHDAGDKKAIQPLINTVTSKVNDSVTLGLSTIGNFDSFEWKFSDWTNNTTKIPSLKKVFRTEWNHTVLVKWLINNEVIVASEFTIAVGKWKWIVLNSSVLNPDKWATVYFTSKISGFFPKDVRTVNWDFGDGSTIDTQDLTINHVYKTSWKKAVVQTISLADGSVFKQILTLYVVSPYWFNSYSMSFVPDMQGSLLKPLSVTTNINWSFWIPLVFMTTYGDTQSQKFGTLNISSPFKSSHRYLDPGVYYPQTTLLLDACTALSSQATLDVEWEDFCLKAKLNGTLSKLGCDMDKDWIPDICSSDIDGDGKPNLIGIITDPKQCNYTQELASTNLGKYSKDGWINYDILDKHFGWSCTLDNDPFHINPDQADNNNNNIWDTLDSLLAKTTDTWALLTQDSFLDSDGDWIPDSQDLCPSITETYNGIQDTDWCPEIWAEFMCENSRFPTINGNRTNDWDNQLCGNGKIDPGETCQSCPPDIWICTPKCGNEKIDPGETCQTCPSDVWTCISSCGNGTQEAGETCENCPVDVASCTPKCGNSIQEAGETCQLCPSDWKYCDPLCGNGKIDPGETCQTCPPDIQRCFSQCGNGIVETNLWEACDNGLANNWKDGKCTSNCALIKSTPETCGNGVQDPGETCLNCPTDAQWCFLIATQQCLQCPCPFADFSASLANWDQIKAVLWDKTKKYPWQYSLWFDITY